MSTSSLRDHTEVDRWTIEAIVAAMSPEPSSRRRIELPRYQRNIRWNDDKRAGLIESIKSGYPIGSLLLYKKADDTFDSYSLVDGLQRCYTLTDYIAAPLKYVRQSDIPEEYINLVARMSGHSEPATIQIKTLEWLKGRKSFNEVEGYSAYWLISYLTKEADLDIDITNHAIHTEFATFLHNIRSSSDINHVQIPILVYSRDRGKLPDIFERINSKATPLNKYEVFAATWFDTEEKTNDKAILAAVRAKYEQISETAGLVIDDLDIDDIEKTGEITLFEYLFGFSKVLKKRRQVTKVAQLFIKYLYASRINVLQNAQDEFELEHLIPVERLAGTVELDGLNGLPISCVANLALLPKALNKKKGKLTIVEYYDTLVAKGDKLRSAADAEMADALKFAFVKSEDSLRIPNREDNSATPTAKWYEAFLRDRMAFLVEQFIESYGIPTQEA